jgi:hypothetical protein
MRSFLVAALLSLASCVAWADAPQVHDLSMSFVEFWDANHAKPRAERLAAFQRDVASRYPAFYGIARYHGDVTQAERDDTIDAAIGQFADIRTAYLGKARQFELDLPRYLASFQRVFPDFQLHNDVYLLHSLGEMDGGTRTFDGKDVLIFGVDGMVRYHEPGSDPSAFFHHELFHLYHQPAMAACDGDDPPVWSALWQEGVAVYVSRTLDPKANDEELELDFPRGSAARTRKAARAGMAQMETVLERADKKTYNALFSTGTDATGLPSRRGYYLGYLVAQEAGKTRSLQALAHLDCAQSHALVVATVHALNASAIK